jgi:hypothetical protein
MSFANSERQRRWREKQRSLLAMEVRGNRQPLESAHVGDTGTQLFQKMKVTGPRTAQFIGEPLQALHDIQHAGGKKVRGDGKGMPPTFAKIRVTGPRCAEPITEPLQAMRELNPPLNEMIRSTEQMNELLCEAAKQPLNKGRMTASSAVAIHNAHLQRLKAHMSDTVYGYNPIHTLEQASQMSHEEPAAHSSQAGAEDETSLGSHASMQKVMSEIPKKFHNKIATLGNYLSARPDLIRVSPSGEPIVAGKQIPHAHIMDIMRSLYIWPRSQPLPSGLNEVIAALRSAGAPSYLLSNSTVRAMYTRLSEAVGQSPVETEEQEPEGQLQEEEEQETQEEEEEQEPEGREGQVTEGEEEQEEQETTSLFETPLHTALPPLLPTRKAEERVPVKPSTSLKPKLAHATGRFSGIPTVSTKREAGKGSTSQAGHGRSGIREEYRSGPHLPGNPLHILRLYDTSTNPPMLMKRKFREVDSPAQTRQYTEGITEHIYDDPRMPGKKTRVLRLY